MKFTDRALAAIKPKDGGRLSLSDDGQAGLSLRVSQSGAKTFYADYRFRKERRRVKIGLYPDIPLKDARARVRKILLDVGNDIDPAPSIATGPTVGDTVEEYERLYLPSLKAGHERSVMLRRDLSHLWGKRIAEITRNDLEAILRQKRKEGKIGNRVRAYLMAFFTWANEDTTMLAGENPAAKLSKPQKEVAHERVLSMDELHEIWNAASDMPAVRLLMLTAARRSEITGLKWSEVSHTNSRLELAGGRTKNSKPHFIHLSHPAISIIDEQQQGDSFVFDAHDRTLNRVMKSLPTFDEPYRLHDFRRAFATHSSEAGVSAEVVELALGHKLRGIMAVYNRAERLDDRARALDKWADMLTQKASQVVQLHV